MSDEIKISSEMWNLLMGKIDTLGDSLDDFRKEVREDRATLKTDRTQCNTTHNTRMQTLEDKVGTINVTMAKWTGGGIVLYAGILILLKVVGII